MANENSKEEDYEIESKKFTRYHNILDNDRLLNV